MNTPQVLRSSPSFALISVLALVSLAALSATAFLAAARLERLASRPLADVIRLEMANSTGLAMAMGVLAQAGSTNYGLQRIVTYWRDNETDEIGYPLLGIFNNPTDPIQVTYLPAFSTAPMAANALDPNSSESNAANVTGQGLFRSNAFPAAWTNGLIANSDFGLTNREINLPLLGDQTSPPVAWIPIWQERRLRPGSTNFVTVPVARVAFFVQDLQGLIDAERMGGEPVRATGTNPAEISLTNLSGTALMNAATASNFVATNTRRLFASVGMLRTAGGLGTNDLRYVATGLRSWQWSATDPTNSFSNRIPPGIQITATAGYSTSAGGLKFDLNAILADTNNPPLPRLSLIFSQHLPDFGGRGGAMSSGAYLNNLAANIVDYADADSIPTTDGSMDPVYRGVEAIPWLNEIFTRIELVSQTVTGNQYRWVFSLTDYVEVWNSSDRDVSLAGLTFFNNQNLEFWVGSNAVPGKGIRRMFNTVDANCAPTNASLTSLAGITNLSANAYAVLTGPARTLQFNTTTNTNILGTANPRVIIPAASTLGFTYSVNSGVVSKGTRWTGPDTFLTNTGTRVVIYPSAAAFGVSESGNIYNLLGGDPRGQLFLGQSLMDISYDNSTPGGRNRYPAADGGANTVNPALNWPDGGHTTNADISTLPTGVSQAPDSFPNLAGSSNHPVQRINNSGTFRTVFELGNIFDPIQWGGPNPFHLRDTAAWMELSSVHVASNAACGRNTLRFGRPEHPRFAFTNFSTNANVPPVPNMGMSAVALLDLFRIAATDSADFAGGGKINLNTAPAPVLAALAGGVSLTNDPSRVGNPANSNMTNAFVQGVLKFRQLYPFYSPSQLSFISTDYGTGTGAWTNSWSSTAVFGTNQSSVSTNGLAGVTSLNDEGREEWFSRIYGLSGVDSLNFRCYVVAQLTDTNGRPRSAPQRKYYQIYTMPDPAGPAATPARPSFRPVVVEEGTY